eukprot:6192130-Pleurochrysis_carterae.AAC.1
MRVHGCHGACRCDACADVCACCVCACVGRMSMRCGQKECEAVHALRSHVPCADAMLISRATGGT